MTPRKELSDRDRAFYLARRRALLMELGAVEELLGIERSVEPKSKKKKRSIIDRDEKAR